MPTITIYANKSFCTRNTTPDTNVVPGASVTLSVWSDREGYIDTHAYFAFSIPDELHYKRITGSEAKAYVNGGTGPRDIVWAELYGSPSVSNTITWNNSPDNSGFKDLCKDRSHSGWHWERDYIANLSLVLENGIVVVGGKDTYIQTSYSTNKPCLEITYEPIYYNSADGYPASGFSNEKQDIVLSWKPNRQYWGFMGDPCIVEAEIAYRDGVNPWVSQIVRYATSERRETASITIPAGTIKSSTLQHKLVRVVSNDNVVSAGFSTVLTLSTVDAVSTAIAVSPLNDRVDISVPLSFVWQHIVATGTAQSKAELQYSVDNAAWTTFYTAQGEGQSGVVPAHTLPAGKVWWRVRTFNSDNVAGGFSASVAIIGHGAPPAPLGLSVTNAARPVVRWQSQSQVAYELKIKQNEREVVMVREFASTAKQYVVADYMADGSYTAWVRIKNKSMEFSPWNSCDFEIKTVKPAAPVVAVTSINCGVYVETSGSFAKTYLLRDGIAIAKFSGSYTDYSATGWHDYVVRGVDASDRFADSSPHAAQSKIEGVIIAPAAMPSAMVLLPYRVDQNDGYQSTVTPDTTVRHYAGRTAPVMHTSGFVTQAIPISFGSRDDEKWKVLCELLRVGETVLYRSAAGDCVYGFLQSGKVSASMGITSVEMELIKTDYIEQILYDPLGVT